MSRLDTEINGIRSNAGEIQTIVENAVVDLEAGGVEISDIISRFEEVGSLAEAIESTSDELETEADDMEDEVVEDAISKDDVESWIDSAENNMSEIFSDLQSKVRWGY